MFNPVPSVAQTFFPMDLPPRSFNSYRSINPFDAVRQIHQSVDEFMNRTARAFFADFEALSEAAFYRPRVVSGNDAPVPFHQNRQQWYELNVNRPSERLPPPSASAKRAVDVLDQLPVSIVRVKATTNNSASACKQSIQCSNSSEASGLRAHNCEEEEQATVHEPGQVELVLKLDRSKYRSINQLIPINQLHATTAGGKPECEICLGEYTAGDRVRHMPCGHLFHVKCVDTWLHSADTCPKCRKNIIFGLRRLHTQHMREQRARTQSLTLARLPQANQNTPAETSSAATAHAGRPASTSRPTELANRRPFHQTRSSILRSQLAEQRRQEASRPPPLPTTRSRRDQLPAGMSRPVPARRTQIPTNRRISPSSGARSVTPARSGPRERPAGGETAPRSHVDCVLEQRGVDTAAEAVQKISVNATNPREFSQQHATTVAGLPVLSSSYPLGPLIDKSRQVLSEEEKSREARRKAGEAAILRALQVDAQSAASAATLQ